MTKKILTLAAVLGSIWTSSGAVTVQGWWHYGEVPDYYFDSSGNARRFTSGFSCAGGGNAGAGIVEFGVGGPLGTSGYTSTKALYWTPLRCSAAAMWNPWGTADVANEWNPPATNYVIECWILPEGSGIGSSATRTWFFASGSSDFTQPTRPQRTGPGGVYFAVTNTGTFSQIGAFVIPNSGQGVPDTVQIGDLVNADTNNWMHVAIVNDNGVNSFYVNGVKRGASTTANTIPNGNIFAGGSPGTTPTFRGWMDELRMSTFGPGEFAVSDLLLRPPGPAILTQPQSASVWNGGAAPFTVFAVKDSGLTYQWRRGGAVISGATTSSYVLPEAFAGDSGATFDCVLTSGGISLTSSVATLTVVPARTGDADYYRQAITADPNLLAYFITDGCLGTTLTNVEDVTRHGTLEGEVIYDGRTNRAFGQRALTFGGAGDVQIPNNPGFDFSGGNGTIEALVYLEGTGVDDRTIFAWAWDGSTIGYALQASKDGAQLLYVNDAPTSLSWTVPVNLIGRMAHIALVFDNTTNVTLIVDGQSLGTKVQTAMGPANGAPLWIGATGTSLGKPFQGSIDEVAVYGAALSLNTLQVHYSRFLYGTNVSAPSILSQSGDRTVLAGTAPLLQVQVTGTLPITYQWKSNGIAIPGANAANFKVVSGPGSTAATYVLYATNDVGWAVSQPIAITFNAPPSLYSAAVAAAAPIAYWRLNESSGTNAVDSAGYHDATYSGSLVLGAPAVITTETDPAVSFTGGEARLRNYPELNPAGPFSVELWTRPNTASSAGIILGSQNRANSRGGYVIHANFFTAEYAIDLGAPNSSVTRYISSTLPATGVPVHIVFAWDGISPQGALYVNGAKTTTPSASFTQNMNSFVNNTVQPLTIGKRYDGSGAWNGTVDEVAIYDYALTDAQVTNHWSFIWSAPNITRNPANVTTNEWSTFTLSVEASGYPNTYQWYKVGVGALNADTPNNDGTLHYPGGVTGPTLTITQPHPTADSGQYYVVVANSLGTKTSANATVTITADTAPPTVVSVTAPGTPNQSGPSPFLVKVVFNERIDPTFGSITGNYAVSGGVTVNEATVSKDWLAVTLKTSGLTPGQKYSVTVSGVKDQSQTGNTIVPAPAWFWAPVLSQGLGWDYWYLGPNTSLIDLLTSSYYPYAADTNLQVSSFDTAPITGSDLRNAPSFFGARGDNYGANLSGWITPTVSGDYTFFLSSDDQSELYLSSNADPLGAVKIAEETDCCDAFQEPGDAATSLPQTLTAGQAYYIRAVHKEGGGGDYMKVAWRISTDATLAKDLPPIPAQFLTAYLPLPPARFNKPVLSGNILTITWTGVGTLKESTDLKTWSPVPGNPSSPYPVNVTSGPLKFYSVVRE